MSFNKVNKNVQVGSLSIAFDKVFVGLLNLLEFLTCIN